MDAKIDEKEKRKKNLVAKLKIAMIWLKFERSYSLLSLFLHDDKGLDYRNRFSVWILHAFTMASIWKKGQ